LNWLHTITSQFLRFVRDRKYLFILQCMIYPFTLYSPSPFVISFLISTMPLFFYSTHCWRLFPQ